MEKLLMVWLTEKQIAGDTVTEAIICEKARAIYTDLMQQTPGTSTGGAPGEPFKASRGWFENFKKRTGIHSVVRRGEAASADMKAAEDYLKTFAGIIVAEGYIPHEVFSCDETGLFWKKMPRRTYITVEEKRMPGHKPMKDRLALATDAAGDIEVLQEIGDTEEVISTIIHLRPTTSSSRPISKGLLVGKDDDKNHNFQQKKNLIFVRLCSL
ncbi:unnamed protein product [Acanthosepion pharaonis]|uniref:HTH CENPB-type domain-containing protein n=1 Tax=Acanthosepion pharaonis TaxID=158019 RepID=A0A812ATU7_ACAPH|nr:unnamed protein product [Sepia pharaonis]